MAIALVGNIPAAESRNQVGVMFGTPLWAFKIDFSHKLMGEQSSETTYTTTEDSTPLKVDTMNGNFENTLAFFGEFGLFLASGRIRPSLRLGIDMYELSDNRTSTRTEQSSGMVAGTYRSEYLSDFTEPTLGLALNFRFLDSTTSLFEAGFTYDLGFRLYKNNSIDNSKIRTISNNDPT
jgi:hypothetical protein